MKKLILLLCLLGAISLNAQSWRQSDGTVKNLNADLTLKNPVVADLTYTINGVDFSTPVPVSPKLYRSKRILSVRLINNRIIVKHTGYVNRHEWIGRIVWKEIYNVQSGDIQLQRIVDGNYTPPQTTDEEVTFSDE